MSKIKVNIGHLKRDNIKIDNKKKIKDKKDDTDKKVEEVVNSPTGNSLLPVDLDINITFTEDKKINDFLSLKSKELTRVQASARLHLGSIFQAVYDELSGKTKYDGLYSKWLEFNGYNKMTALRHRNRLEIYNEMKTDTAKAIIATVPQKIINKLLRLDEKKIIYDKLNDSMTREELINMFVDKPQEIEPPENFNFEENYKKFEEVYQHLNINDLPKTKQKKLEKLIEQFLKIVEA